MPLPSFNASVGGSAPPALQAWAVRSAVALGADAVRFRDSAPSPEARAAAESLRIPLMEGGGNAESVLRVPSLPSPPWLRRLLPPAEANLGSAAMEAAFAPWAGPGAESPVGLFAAALARYRVPMGFDHGVRLTQRLQAAAAEERIESARLAPADANDAEPASLDIPLFAEGPGVPFSALDPDGGWRLAMRRLREALLPAFLGTLLADDGETLRVLVSNRRREPLQAWAHWRVVRTDGFLLDEGGAPFAIPPRSSAEVGSLPLGGLIRHCSAGRILVWAGIESDSGERLFHRCVLLRPPRLLALQDPAIAVETEAVPGRSVKGLPAWRRSFRVLFPGHDDETETRRDGGHWFRVTLTAMAPALGVLLSAPGLSGLHFGDNDFELESEWPREILVRSERPLTAQAFRRALRVESLFDTYVEDR